eukprot:6459969-Amphidinium_carterae.1
MACRLAGKSVSSDQRTISRLFARQLSVGFIPSQMGGGSLYPFSTVWPASAVICALPQEQQHTRHAEGYN